MFLRRSTVEHAWFAWHPVRTEAGEWCWLETVQRRWTYWPWFHYVYTSEKR